MSDAAIDPVAPEPAPEAAKPEVVSAGAQLRQERMRQGLSLADVARHLKLAPRQVEALEQDAYKSLPGPVFVRGFTRNYARLLGLDAELLVRLAEQSPDFPEPALTGVTAPSVSAPVVTRSSRSSGDRSQGRRGWVPVTAALIVAAVVILYFSRRDGEVKELPPEVVQPQVAPPAATPPAPAEAVATTDPGAATPVPAGEGSPAAGAAPSAANAPAAVPGAAPATAAGPAAGTAPPPSGPTPPATATEPPKPAVPAAEKPAEAKPAPSTKPAAEAASVASGDGHEIKLSFAREAWVEVKDAGGNVIFSQLNAAGSERAVRGQPPFQLVVGSASGVTVTYDAKPVDLTPHTRTDVARFTLE